MNDNNLKSSIYVANSILISAKEQKIKLNPIKLYNLIYLIYSEYLYETGQKLFSELFEVTPHGPVLPSVWGKFNSYSDNFIETFASDAKGIILAYKNKGIYGEILNKILNYYKDYFLLEIMEITTGKNSAYNKAKTNNINVLSDKDILDEVITRKSMELEKLKKYIK